VEKIILFYLSNQDGQLKAVKSTSPQIAFPACSNEARNIYRSLLTNQSFGVWIVRHYSIGMDHWQYEHRKHEIRHRLPAEIPAEIAMYLLLAGDTINEH